MRNVFKLTLVAAAISLAGCSMMGSKQPVELESVEAQSQYDDRMQDALGPQRYAEAQIIYQRRLNDYQSQLDDLEQKRRDLDARLNARAYESGLGDAPVSDTEAGRIHEYQAASRASQSRVAEASSKMTIQQSIIENRRDTSLLEVERRSAQKIAEIETASANELSLIEDRINQDIEGQRSLDSAARMAESQRFNEQRFTLALANVDSERQAKEALARQSSELERIRGETSTEVNAREAEIADLRRKISEVEAMLLKVRGAGDLAERAQLAKVEAAKVEVERLAKITQDLKATQPTMQAGLSPAGADYVQAKNVELSKARATADSKKARQIAELNAQSASEKNEIVARARTEIASLSATTEMAKAEVLAPVVTGRAVYGGHESVRPAKDEASDVKPAQPASPLLSQSKASPVLTINRFEPKVDSTPSTVPNDEIGGSVIAGGGGVHAPSPRSVAAPLVVAPKNRTVYDVFYVYKDEGSWTKFQEYLKAYGITDFEPTRSNSTGEFFIYCGRYYKAEEAAARVTYLSKTTATSNVKVRESVVPL